MCDVDQGHQKYMADSTLNSIRSACAWTETNIGSFDLTPSNFYKIFFVQQTQTCLKISWLKFFSCSNAASAFQNVERYAGSGSMGHLNKKESTVKVTRGLLNSFSTIRWADLTLQHNWNKNADWIYVSSTKGFCPKLFWHKEAFINAVHY